MCHCGGCHVNIIIDCIQRGLPIPSDSDCGSDHDNDYSVDVGVEADGFHQDYEPEPTRITLSDAKNMGVRPLPYLIFEPKLTHDLQLREEELATITAPIIQENRQHPTYSNIKLFLHSEVAALAERKKNGEVIGPQPRAQDAPKRKGKVSLALVPLFPIRSYRFV